MHDQGRETPEHHQTQVNYIQLIMQMWKTQISEDAEEDQVVNNTKVNCNYGMLAKHTNRSQKTKLFDTYEEAKFFQQKKKHHHLHRAIRGAGRVEGG